MLFIILGNEKNKFLEWFAIGVKIRAVVGIGEK